MVENLDGGRKYMADMNISLCTESAMDCDVSITVLKKTILPRIKCQLTNGFNIPGRAPVEQLWVQEML